MMKHYLDFEKPLVDLERESERLKRFSSGRPFHLDDHLKDLEEKLHLSDLEKMDLDDRRMPRKPSPSGRGRGTQYKRKLPYREAPPFRAGSFTY